MRQKWACWKGLDVYFPTQVEFLNLVSICPSKMAISQDCFLCVKKVAESHFLLVFWPSGGSKLGEISWYLLSKCILSWQIQKCKHFLKWTFPSKGSRTVRDSLVEKTCFLTKNSQVTKNAQNFLKFVLGLSHLAPCSFKESSAKMWRGSGLFRRFSALANLLGSGDCNFDISLKPWHLWKEWRRFFFFGMLCTKTSLSFPKFIFYCSETPFEWNLSRCVKQGILSKWSEMKGIRGF